MSKSASASPRRLLLVADTVGGVWSYALELSRALKSHNVDILLATMGAPLSSDQRADAAALPHVNIAESSYKLEWMDEPRADIERAGTWLLELEDDFQPDIVHLNSFSHAVFPWQAPRIVVGHSCVLSWWQAVHHCDAPDEWDEYRQWVEAGIRSADVVVAPSKAMLVALNEHYGPLRTSMVIANGRRLSGIHTRNKQDLIFTAGRLWDEAKNASALAHIAPRLPWPVFLAGEAGSSRDGGAQPGVHYTGRLSSAEMIQWLERAAIYAAPARYEPFGLSILEAAIAGCALVLGDIPSLREIWGDAAVFVDPNDSDGLEKALQDLINDRKRRTAFATNARRTAALYTPEIMAEGYLSAYALAMNRRAQPAVLEKNVYARPEAQALG